MRILLKNGRILCPAEGLDEKGDLLVDRGRIVELGGELYAGDAAEIDCAGLVVAPGFIDMHVHLREPGHEYKETVASGSEAAASGGFTAVACMPNTRPVNDSRGVTELILAKAAAAGKARVYPVGAITPGLSGQGMSEMAELKEAGCVAVSDDGRPVADSRLFRRAMEYASGFGLPILCHSEDMGLSAHGVMHEGPHATKLGLGGIPAQAESICVARDLALAGLTGAKTHICHVSTALSVEEIRKAKERGWPVTAETAPHYLTLTDQDVGQYDTHAKMNPPLRSAEDRQAVRDALADGTIDAVATDHAPHSVLEKAVEFDNAAFGVVGLETSVGLMLALVEQGVLSLEAMIRCMSAAPAAILGVEGGRLAKGAAADITVLNPASPWTVDPALFRSKSANTPFAGRELPGRAVLTICGGRITSRLES